MPGRTSVRFSAIRCFCCLFVFSVCVCFNYSLFKVCCTNMQLCTCQFLICPVVQLSNYTNVIFSNVRCASVHFIHGPLARYVKLRVAHAPVMPGTFFPPPRVSDPDIHQGTCVTHVPWCMPGSLTRGFLWSLWRGKRSRHSRCMRNPQFYLSGKRPMPMHYCPLYE